MATTSVNIRMDTELKKEFDAFCKDMGMTMTTAFNIFARKTVREYRIPFEVGGSNPKQELLDAMQEAEDIANGKIKTRSYSSAREMIDDILRGNDDEADS